MKEMAVAEINKIICTLKKMITAIYHLLKNHSKKKQLNRAKSGKPGWQFGYHGAEASQPVTSLGSEAPTQQKTLIPSTKADFPHLQLQKILKCSIKIQKC